MVTKIQDGLVTYIGFDTNENRKFIVETKGNWTYINYQKDEFTRIICGYVVRQQDGRYRTHRLGTFDTNFKDRNVKYFDSLNDGIAYMKQVYIQELYPNLSIENMNELINDEMNEKGVDTINKSIEIEEDLDELEK
ncbi:hypothetical protein MKC55_20500 [[Clostridium] innocuum]|nr:hypothetical protein [[Clostridium] innocuum]